MDDKQLLNADELVDWLWRFTHGAPRTWSELVGALSGAGANALERDEDPSLPAEQEELVRYYTRLLNALVRVRRVRRTFDSDPRHDTYGPVPNE